MKHNISLRKLGTVLAVSKGYKVKQGILYNKSGDAIATPCDKARYPYVTIKMPRSRKDIRVHIHLITAYQKYGFELLITNLEIRHLDGNKMNFQKDNIVLGTKTENHGDKSEENKRRFYVAGAMKTRRMTDSQYTQFRLDRESGLTFKELAKKYGLNDKGHASYLYRNPYKTKKD